MSELFPTQEIGSLPKHNWRVKPFKEDKTVTEADIDEAVYWGEELDVTGERFHYEDLVSLLEQGEWTPEEQERITSFSQVYAINLLETYLDEVYDGEQTRIEMYEYPMQFINGVEERGHVRSFDNTAGQGHKYWKTFAAVDDLSVDAPYHLDEFSFVQEHAEKPLKIPVTGPYTLMDWSFNEYFPSRAAFADALATEVLRPHLQSLIDAGAEHIQIDEPAASTKPDEIPLFVDAVNEAVRGLDARFSVHLCFNKDYTWFFPQNGEERIAGLENVEQLSPEFANRDTWQPGVSAEERQGYTFLDLVDEYGLDVDIGLGVIDIHTDQVESVELVRDRILYAAETLSPDRIRPSTDCGMRTRDWTVIRDKLEALQHGAEEARNTYQ